MKTPKHPVEDFLRRIALAYPEAQEEFPWGERAIKVRKKVFLFLRVDDGGLFHMSVKLPASHLEALTFPGAEPTGYGLGPHGWVTFRFPPDELPPLEFLRDYVDESYRAVAPKKLSAQLPAPQDPD